MYLYWSQKFNNTLRAFQLPRRGAVGGISNELIDLSRKFALVLSHLQCGKHVWTIKVFLIVGWWQHCLWNIYILFTFSEGDAKFLLDHFIWASSSYCRSSADIVLDTELCRSTGMRTLLTYIHVVLSGKKGLWQRLFGNQT